MALLAFLKRFPDDAACWAHLEASRWPEGPVCPKCGGARHHKIGRPHYLRCTDCRVKFTAAHGTPFEGTHLPLRVWFTALYLVAGSSKGISSVKLGEHLDVTQKTAWFLGQRIRRMMEDRDGLLRGIVEADEVYLGGKNRKDSFSKRDDESDQPRGRSGSRKTMVTVAVERGGRARAKRGATHSGKTIAKFVYENVSRDGSVLATDELPAYKWIGRKFPAHVKVNHSQGEYVRYDSHAAATAHINNAESFNGTVKRAVMGVWHWFSIKHTDRYLTEIAFRWNERKADTASRIDTMLLTSGRRLRWRELTA
jgi:transposase-like protein